MLKSSTFFSGSNLSILKIPIFWLTRKCIHLNKLKNYHDKSTVDQKQGHNDLFAKQ